MGKPGSSLPLAIAGVAALAVLLWIFTGDGPGGLAGTALAVLAAAILWVIAVKVLEPKRVASGHEDTEARPSGEPARKTAAPMPAPEPEPLDMAPEAAPPDLERAGAAPMDDDRTFDIVRVHYATNRAWSGRAEPDAFSGDRGTELLHGTADVSIPRHRDLGSIPRPTWWRLEFREDPDKHVIVKGLDPLSREDAVDSMRATIAESPMRQVLLFVHGYNSSFADALRRTAQLAYDLDFGGLPFCFSWPSTDKMGDYDEDGERIDWAVPDLVKTLTLIRRETGAECIHLIAYSMGARAVADALDEIARDPATPGEAPIRQTLLAAPDIDAGIMGNMAARLVSSAERVTIYASSRDKALAAAKVKYGFTRAGLLGQEPFIYDGIDTIDASGADLSFLGHSAISASSVLSDMYQLVQHGQPPDDRFGLVEQRRDSDNALYWLMRG